MKSGLFIVFFTILVALSLPGCGGDAEKYPGKLTFIAVDGADWDVIDPLVARGLLPHFQKAIERGTRADLMSLGDEWVFKPEEGRWGTSPAIWTSAATGKLPEEHGITDFIVRDGDITFPITSNYLSAMPVWEILGERGRKVALVGWWASWPAKPLNGFVVSDHVGISRWDLTTTYRSAGLELHADTYPASLLEEIRPARCAPEDITAAEAMKLCGIQRDAGELKVGSKLFELKIAISADLTYSGAGLYLIDTYHPDFITVYIEGIDIIQHLFWKYMPGEASRFGTDPAEVENLGKVVELYHVFVDSLLGEFMQRMGERDCLIIASDHGFQPSRVREKIHISGEHERRGILLMYGSGIQKGTVLGEVSILDIAPMILYMENMPLARDMKGSVPLAAFSQEMKEQRTLAYVETYERERTRTEPLPIPSPVDSHLLEKLEALGYITREGEKE
jgi:predicted AlkP superfamily pyrophosphatase or phosphodiesterase